jgi:hypothetical protein
VLVLEKVELAFQNPGAFPDEVDVDDLDIDQIKDMVVEEKGWDWMFSCALCENTADYRIRPKHYKDRHLKVTNCNKCLLRDYWLSQAKSEEQRLYFQTLKPGEFDSKIYWTPDHYPMACLITDTSYEKMAAAPLRHRETRALEGCREIIQACDLALVHYNVLREMNQ